MKASVFVAKEINKKFLKAKAKNKNYSIRAFANQIGISKTYAADILSGNKNVTKTTLLQIFEKFKFTEKEKEDILFYYSNDKINSELSTKSQMQTLEEETFKLIATWYSQALYCLLGVKNPPKTLKNLATKLNISEDELKQAITNLKNLKLIEENDNGEFFAKDFALSSTDNIPSECIKKNHSEIIDLAKKSLVNDSVEVRDITNITFAINTKKIDKAREIIKKFQIEMSEVFDGEECDEVYNLAVQFFPLTKKGE